MLSVYIHIPFCKSRCRYCDFFTCAGRTEQLDDYVGTLCEEIRISPELENTDIRTVYFGGGTPSLLRPEQVSMILSALHQRSNVLPDCEITLEANPGTVEAENLAGYRRAGVNRLSLGVQSADETILRMLGRIHTLREAESTFLAAREAGFGNISVDLMFGLPGQTMAQWHHTVGIILAWKPEHISAYSLKVEDGTPLEAELASGRLPWPDEETDRRMYHDAIRLFRDAGILHYELSNFAVEGFESRHNTVYWTGDEYLALGAGAHGMTAGVRWQNPEDVAQWRNLVTVGCQGRIIHEHLTDEERLKESVMLGLRMIRGVSVKDVGRRFGVDLETHFQREFDFLTKQGLIEEKNGFIFMTAKGLDLANSVFEQFV